MDLGVAGIFIPISPTNEHSKASAVGDDEAQYKVVNSNSTELLTYNGTTLSMEVVP